MGRNRAALVLWAWLVASAGIALVVQAETLAELRQRGSLRVAVYNDFPPFSQAGRGIDVELAQALGERLGLGVELVWFNADEDMNDDLRNMVWKGHYLGGRVADAMLHVPVDPYLAQKNPQVKILAPYHREQMALAWDTRRISGVEGVAGLEVFAHEKIAVELATLPDDFLSTLWNGRLRESVVRYTTAAEAVRALPAPR
jgi:polar amino acid transport system substrate-binding protein